MVRIAENRCTEVGVPTNKDSSVGEFMAKLDHPLKDEMERVREIVLSTDDRMAETIKRGGPTFMYKGNMATLKRWAKNSVNRFFQTGSVIGDRHGVLEGNAARVRAIKSADMDEVNSKENGLRAVAKQWINARDGTGH